MADHAEARSRPRLSGAYPQLFVTDMARALAFYAETLGFTVAFAYGDPPFYAQLRRDRARLNLRHVDGPVFAGDVREREDLLSAHIPVENVTALYREVGAAGASIHRKLAEQPWDATDFIVKDPDGNLLCFSSPTDLQD
ncbi:MAG TPA: VOC family protein [Beijerinckiaceae bacterium]|nr:VOC family protein [Beijerinckiaceae bacterium]